MTLSEYSREHADALASTLPPLTVDRQRIVRCAAFRRLQHKTQVFVAPDNDHFRTRLTHTLEVAHLARTLAERAATVWPHREAAAAPDAELAEIVALAHDLGHPPFGHAGEAALNACMKDHGGFEHNRQTLRIVEELEHPYPEFRGLNLTRVVRECLAKHSTQYDRPGGHPLQDGRPPPIEGRIVDLADRVSYALHDLQDGLYAGLLDPAAVNSLRIWRQADADEADRFRSEEGQQGGDAAERWRARLRPTLDQIERRVLDDLTAAAAELRISDALDADLGELDAFLLTSLYRHPTLQTADGNAARILSDVFGALVADRSRLPPRFRRRIGDVGAQRVVADYVAGMTDRFCTDEHARLCG